MTTTTEKKEKCKNTHTHTHLVKCAQKLVTAQKAHGRELPQVLFLSRQTRLLLRQKYACLDKTFFMTKYVCRDKIMLVITKLLSREKYVCRDKSVVVTDMLLSRQK